jgi:hypothetical protein
MIERPVYVTIIGWVLIVIGVLSLLSTPAVLYLDSAHAWLDVNLLPLPVQIALNLASALVSLVAGYYILNGRNWARLLFVGWSVAETALSLFTSPESASSSIFLLWVGILVLIVVLLFTPAANRFFGSGPATEAAEDLPVA